MKWSAAVAIGAVGLVGGVLAAVALAWTSAPVPAEPVLELPAPVQDGEAEAPRTRASAPAPATEQPLADGPGEAPTRVVLGPAFDAPVEAAADLQPRFDAAMSMDLSLDDLPSDSPPAEVETALEQRMLQVTASVNAAADAHLQFAEQAPRSQATAARGKAAELYEHLSDVLLDAPVPEHFPADQAALQRSMSEKMSQTYQRKAAALRAGGAR